jgi:hypothetical protein
LGRHWTREVQAPAGSASSEPALRHVIAFDFGVQSLPRGRGLFALRQVYGLDAAVLAGERVSRFLQPGLAVTAKSRVSGVIPWRHARRAFTASAGFSGNCWL